MQIELLYFTVIHTCEHIGCKPYRKNDPKIKLMQNHTVGTERTIYSPYPCKVCAELYERAAEHRSEMAAREADQRAAISLEQHAAQKRYLVDGKPMKIVQDKAGNWRGKSNQERGVTIQKHFGKTDPRPMLQEVEL